MKKGLLLVLIVLLGSTQLIYAQTKKLTGTVTSSEDGKPVPGVSISLKGTTIGTVTNMDGAFQLNVPTNAKTLVFTFVGLKTKEVEITSSNTYNVALDPDVFGVDEVLIVAYGTAKKESVVGSVSAIRGDEKLSQIPISSLDKALQGNVAGVVATSASGQPGSRTQVRIRGIGSMSGTNEPLYVIDGVPVVGTDYISFTSENSPMASRETSNPLANINPNDIENISVLKDASAAALYGSRAANGVILITTKKGKEGKTAINFSVQTGFSGRTSNNFEVCNKDEYESLVAEAIYNAFPSDYNTVDDALAEIHTDYNTDWYDVVYRDPKDAMTYNAELSAKGGTEKTQFFTSASYFKQNGNVLGTDFTRYSSRLNIDHKASDKIKLGMNISLSYSDKNAIPGSSGFASPILAADLMQPNKPVYNDDGSYNNDNLGMLNKFNPVAINEWDRNFTNEVYIIGSAYAEYAILNNLKFRTSFNTEIYNLKEEKYQNGLFGDGRSVGGRLREGRSTAESFNTSNVLSWNKTFNDVHSFDALVGFEAMKHQENGLIASIENLPKVPKVRAMAAGAKPTSAFSNLTEYSMLSVLSQINYNYNSKYYLSGSFRRDGHSRFGADNRYGNFWSIGGSWRISEESFMDASFLTFLSDAKLRASYGITGSADIGDYDAAGLYSYNGYVYGGSTGSAFIQYPNPGLTWEKSKVLNIAADFTLFNRVTTSVEYYIKKNTDFLFNVPVSAATGLYMTTNYTSAKNIGDMENRGIEIQIRSENIKGKFSWTTDLNFATNKNKILSLPNDKDIITGIRLRRVGEDYQTNYVKEWAGVNPDNGDPQWYLNTTIEGSDELNRTLTNNANLAQKVKFGSASPKFEGGITNTFSYKGFELGAFFSFAVGHYIYDNWAFVMQSDGAYTYSVNQAKAQLDRWQKPGDVTDVPKVIYGGNKLSNSTVHSRDLHKGDFLRLKNLRFSYNFPKTITNAINVDNLKIFAQGQNLATWTKYPGKDPEVQITGVEDWFYPPLKTITFGVSVGF